MLFEQVSEVFIFYILSIFWKLALELVDLILLSIIIQYIITISSLDYVCVGVDTTVPLKRGTLKL